VIVAMFSAVFLVARRRLVRVRLHHALDRVRVHVTMLASLFLLGTALSMSLTDRRRHLTAPLY